MDAACDVCYAKAKNERTFDGQASYFAAVREKFQVGLRYKYLEYRIFGKVCKDVDRRPY